jgi:hypothetical protein
MVNENRCAIKPHCLIKELWHRPAVEVLCVCVWKLTPCGVVYEKPRQGQI